jgi:hypothetical protein
VLYSPWCESQVRRSKNHFHHGKSQEEAPPQDVEAQTPEAPEGEPPQEAYVAEVKICALTLFFVKTRPVMGGFFISGLIRRPVKH